MVYTPLIMARLLPVSTLLEKAPGVDERCQLFLPQVSLLQLHWLLSATYGMPLLVLALLPR